MPLIPSSFSFLLPLSFSFHDVMSVGTWDLFPGALLQAKPANQCGTGTTGLPLFASTHPRCHAKNSPAFLVATSDTELYSRMSCPTGEISQCKEETSTVELGFCSAAETRLQGTIICAMAGSHRAAVLLKSLHARYHMGISLASVNRIASHSETHLCSTISCLSKQGVAFPSSGGKATPWVLLDLLQGLNV